MDYAQNVTIDILLITIFAISQRPKLLAIRYLNIGFCTSNTTQSIYSLFQKMQLKLTRD